MRCCASTHTDFGRADAYGQGQSAKRIAPLAARGRGRQPHFHDLRREEDRLEIAHIVAIRCPRGSRPASRIIRGGIAWL
jgi:hypothetical protein